VSDARSAPLDPLLCFDVYTASHAFNAAYRPLLGELGLTYPQYLVMRVLWCNGDSTVRALGEEVGMDYGTLSPLLKRLEAAGLVRRQRRPDDERSVLVTLTGEGARLREHSDRISEAISAAAGLSAGEVRQLQKLLRKLAANAAAAEPTS
jgi:DNA-binding MarR family transcriptional regulator